MMDVWEIAMCSEKVARALCRAEGEYWRGPDEAPTWRLPSVGSLSALSLLVSSLSLSMEKTSLGGTSSLQPPFPALLGSTGAVTGSTGFTGALDLGSSSVLFRHL